MVSTRSSSRADSTDSPPRSPSPPPSRPSRPSRSTRSTPSSRDNNKPNKPATAKMTSRTSGRRGGLLRKPFRHAPTAWTLLWLGVSLPLVIWDTGYVLGRPHTMEGGPAHWPLWSPYKLYGEVDHVYGWKAVREGSGFTAAQGLLNLVETAMYAAYLWLWRARGQEEEEEEEEEVTTPGGGRGRIRVVVSGRAGALAVVVGFSAAVMTLSKTILYWLNEYFSGFANIGHNDFLTLLFLWIIPNGAWLVGPTYMVVSMGTEIVDNLGGTHAKNE